jgi:probable F420-dependent oxidoreductase
VKIGAFASFMTPVATPDRIQQLARDVENAGLDSLWIGEHVILFDQMEFPYPGSPDGKLPIPAGFGIPDQAATIAWMGAVTSKIRFGTGISLISQRGTIYTAKEFATLDWLTGGRIDLGVGVGWCKEEVEASGFDWNTRGKRTDESLDLMIRLWTEDSVTFNGDFHQVRGGRMHPHPVQKPHIPLIIGGFSDAAFTRTARIGQGWLGFGLNPEMTTMMLARLDQALATAGRNRDDIEIVMMPGVDGLESAKRFADLGVDRLVPLIPLEAVNAPAERMSYLESLARAFH